MGYWKMDELMLEPSLFSISAIAILDRSSVDIYMYVMGSSYENELILLSALDCLFNSVNSLLRKEFEKKALLDKMDLVLLALDEICDSGIKAKMDATSALVQSAKEQLKWSL